MSEEEIEAVREALGARTGEALWAMHLTAFRALCAAGTQWRTRLALTAGNLAERVIGLDYAGLRVALDAIGLALDAEDWRQLMVLERAAAAAMNGEPA